MSFNGNFVFLTGFCQKVELLELVKFFYFTTSNYVFYESLFTFFFCVFQNKICNFANQLSFQFQCIYKTYLLQLEMHPKLLSGEMNKCSFKINIFVYLIMTALLNTVVCSKISLVGDSCREEASQLTCPSWLAGFSSMRAATKGYFRTDYSSKILLLLNLLFFINVFELAISVDHHPTAFFRLEMPVNLNQYGVAIGVFNSHNLITNKNNFHFMESNRVGINILFTLAINVMFFFSFSLCL